MKQKILVAVTALTMATAAFAGANFNLSTENAKYLFIEQKDIRAHPCGTGGSQKCDCKFNSTQHKNRGGGSIGGSVREYNYIDTGISDSHKCDCKLDSSFKNKNVGIDGYGDVKKNNNSNYMIDLNK